MNAAPIEDAAPLNDAEVQSLRAEHYNATVTNFRLIHSDLAVLQVRPDWGRLEFIPGQYTTLGLGYWERRFENVQEEQLEPTQIRQVARRAYSISCPVLDDAGRLLPPAQQNSAEFYIALVRKAERHAPALTPRLFCLTPGDRLFLGPMAHGHYTLASVAPVDDVLFIATGTGEAPHNAMIAQLLSGGHRGRIASIVCTRYEKDLAYREVHRRLEQKYDYCYLTLTTREPQQPVTAGDFHGIHLQPFFQSGQFEKAWGSSLEPARTHAFLCGNPTMIGVPQHTHALRFYPQPTGMVEILEQLGFHLDEPHRPGNLHVEKYW